MTIRATPPGADTRDIVAALAAAVPAACAQLNGRFKATGNPREDIHRAAKYLRDRVRYKADYFDVQNIKFPLALERMGEGDCKSFSLWMCAALSSMNYANGLRLAAYADRPFTHVYNYAVIDGKKVEFDLCTKDLQPPLNPFKTQDMEVHYQINGPDNKAPFVTMAQIGTAKIIKDVNKVLFVPMRAATLEILKLNVRGFASKLYKAFQTPANHKKIFDWWTNVGGKIENLVDAVNTGRTKPFLFGPQREGISGPDAAVLIGAAATVLASLAALLKQMGVSDEDTEEAGKEAAESEKAAKGDWIVADPETGVVPITNKIAAAAGMENVPGIFTPSPALVIGGAAAALLLIFFATKD